MFEKTSSVGSEELSRGTGPNGTNGTNATDGWAIEGLPVVLADTAEV